MNSFNFYKIAGLIITISSSFLWSSKISANNTSKFYIKNDKTPNSNLNEIDTKILPGNDFYNFVNANFLKNTVIPNDKSSVGSFHLLQDLSENRQLKILNELTPNTTINDDKKLSLFYQSFLNRNQINKIGITPLDNLLKKISNLQNNIELSRLLGLAQSSLLFNTFKLGIEQNQKDPSKYIIFLDQGMSIGINGGLGLPDISYYLNPALASKKKDYQDYITALLKKINYQNPEKNAADIIDLETDLAKVETPRDLTRDPQKTFNPISIKDLSNMAPGIDWKELFLAAGIPKEALLNRQINVREPESIKKMSSLIAQRNMTTIQAWLAFHLIDNASPYLSDDIYQHRFNFYGKSLMGIPAPLPIEKRSLKIINEYMGWKMGDLYVKKYFPVSSKKEITNLAKKIKEAFYQRLTRNTWMDQKTRLLAIQKLNNFNIKVGYPEKIRHYDNLDINEDDLIGNINRAIKFNWNYDLSHLDKDVDRQEWAMTPQTVNAYNDPTMNEIVFPAAILEPPFFDANGDISQNYGGIGAVIGHELTHGFDDQGRHYDYQGKLNNWWEEETVKSFDNKAKSLAQQYSNYEILPGLFINGKMTLGEDIADLGGINIAFDALKNKLMEKNSKNTKDTRWSDEQRFFLGWARIWREKDRDDSVRRQVLSNEHAPASARVNIPVRNMTIWYKLFNVKKGKKLYLPPEKRVEIW